MVGPFKFKYLSSFNVQLGGGKIRVRKPTTAYMLALAGILKEPTKYASK